MLSSILVGSQGYILLVVLRVKLVGLNGQGMCSKFDPPSGLYPFQFWVILLQ